MLLDDVPSNVAGDQASLSALAPPILYESEQNVSPGHALILSVP